MGSMKLILFTATEERNFPLIVEHKKVWVSKEVLSMASPVFKKLFYGDFKESQQESIELPDKRLDDIVEMMACLFLYSDQKQIDDTNVDILSKLADEYDIVNFKQRCAAFLSRKVQNSIGYSEIWGCLEIAMKYQYKEVAKLCIPRLARLDTVEIMKRSKAFPDFIVYTILEAKSNRLDKIKHAFRSDGKCYSCNNAEKSVCTKCQESLCHNCGVKPLFCQAFHVPSCPCKNKFPVKEECLCGYEFSDIWLSAD